MPLAAYRCKNCQSDAAKAIIAEHATTQKGVNTEQEFYHRGALPPIGTKIKCGLKGCRKKMERVFSASVGIIVRGKVEVNPNHNVFSSNVNGTPVNFSFIDHEHTSSSYQASVAEAAQATGVKTGPAGLGNMHKDRNGRNVVSVVSNVPDPLGRIERAKRAGETTSTTTKVNTPVKRRKAAKK